MILYLGLALSSCTPINNVQSSRVALSDSNKSTPSIQNKKNPLTISFYRNGLKPPAPYTVIGQATVSKYNIVGIKRQEATIHDAMRTVAASLGGDAIIDIKRDNKTVTGTVIAYQAQTVV